MILQTKNINLLFDYILKSVGNIRSNILKNICLLTAVGHTDKHYRMKICLSLRRDIYNITYTYKTVIFCPLKAKTV